MAYNSIDDIPDQGRQLISELISKGAIEVRDGKIQLDEMIYKVLIILAKLGKL